MSKPDQEILEEWKGGEQARQYLDFGLHRVGHKEQEKAMLRLVELARAAGREEQREKDLRKIDELYEDGLQRFFHDTNLSLEFQDGFKTALDYAEQAIREQGENWKP